MGSDLFAQLIQRSGLSSIFAEKALTRALAKAGIDARRVSRDDIRRALPEIERVLKTYLDSGEVANRVQMVTELAN